MLDLHSLILTAVVLKEGNKEFLLSYDPSFDQPWMAEIGNPVSCVRLGESVGQIGSEWHPTAEEAVVELIARITEYQAPVPEAAP